MKKYIKPAIVEVKIENEVILAGSKEGLLDGETGEQGSKGSFFFDDED